MFYLTQCTYSIIAISNQLKTYQYTLQGFPGGSEGKQPACNVGDPDRIPGSGRLPGERNGNTLQYSCLENPTD